mmetsp:Transcript_44400/g.99959  ORF Transcript_44400/g.99959 Transcript_44400/m.99959 type:complete len:439 (-) Transcript_44400:337-1653(-)
MSTTSLPVATWLSLTDVVLISILRSESADTSGSEMSFTQAVSLVSLSNVQPSGTSSTIGAFARSTAGCGFAAADEDEDAFGAAVAVGAFAGFGTSLAGFGTSASATGLGDVGMAALAGGFLVLALASPASMYPMFKMVYFCANCPSRGRQSRSLAGSSFKSAIAFVARSLRIFASHTVSASGCARNLSITSPLPAASPRSSFSCASSNKAVALPGSCASFSRLWETSLGSASYDGPNTRAMSSLFIGARLPLPPVACVVVTPLRLSLTRSALRSSSSIICFWLSFSRSSSCAFSCSLPAMEAPNASCIFRAISFLSASGFCFCCNLLSGAGVCAASCTLDFLGGVARWRCASALLCCSASARLASQASSQDFTATRASWALFFAASTDAWLSLLAASEASTSFTASASAIFACWSSASKCSTFLPASFLASTAASTLL